MGGIRTGSGKDIGMQMTAVVLNAGLGDLSLGLEKAGFQIIAAYEAEKKAAAIHRANLKAPVFPLPFEENSLKAVPSADLLAARIYQPVHTHAKVIAPEGPGATIHDFLTLLDISCPRAFFLTLRASFIKTEPMQILLNETAGKGYRCIYQSLDIARITGTPVTERMFFIVGIGPDARADFELPESNFPVPLPPEEFLQLKEQIDPWYFNITNHAVNLPACQNGNRFYCWKSSSYVGTNLIQWNCWKIPLIDTGGRFRKITHREVANLKGFPVDYALPDRTNRSWLYQKLIYAANVQTVKQIADGVVRSLTGRTLQKQQVSRGMQFEILFIRFLSKLTEPANIKMAPPARDLPWDFVLQVEDQTLYLELKSYSGRYVPSARIQNACERLSPLSKTGTPVLVLANEAFEQSKSNALEQFHVSIWDVQNLLWLFSRFEDIKNEFVALLDYAIGDIEPVPPALNVFPEGSTASQEPLRQDSQTESETTSEVAGEIKRESTDWKGRLQDIEPGDKHFQEYEGFCTNILKYALGEYLTLWERQEQTDNGLHRFDLCCKIKSGIRQDFFDTIMRYFNTKYIVFEFKNYTDKISQKEIYSTEKYLYGTALRKAAIVISRQGCDDNALRAAKGSLRESGKLILCLSDQDLLEMADIKTQGEKEPADFLGELLDKLLIHLEK